VNRNIVAGSQVEADSVAQNAYAVNRRLWVVPVSVRKSFPVGNWHELAKTQRPHNGVDRYVVFEGENEERRNSTGKAS
jgi:hypothetical protein